MKDYSWLFDEKPSGPRKLKVGDIVRIKPLEWYNANPIYSTFISEMAECCGKEFAIKHIISNNHYLLEGTGNWSFIEEMFDL